MQSSAQGSKKENYLVYDAVIAHMFAGDKVAFDTQSKVRQLVIRDHTNTDYAYWEKKENWEQVKFRLRTLSDETIAGYEAARPNSIELLRSFNLPLPYSLFVQKDYESIFGATKNNNGTEEYWKKFYEKFPESGGYVWLSNVGYNKVRDQALVYFVHWCGTLCGTGHYIQLNKSGTEWKVETIAMIWVS
jgi:hypothetical protein